MKQFNVTIYYNSVHMDGNNETQKASIKVPQQFEGDNWFDELDFIATEYIVDFYGVFRFENMPRVDDEEITDLQSYIELCNDESVRYDGLYIYDIIIDGDEAVHFDKDEADKRWGGSDDGAADTIDDDDPAEDLYNQFNNKLS